MQELPELQSEFVKDGLGMGFTGIDVSGVAGSRQSRHSTRAASRASTVEQLDYLLDTFDAARGAP